MLPSPGPLSSTLISQVMRAQSSPIPLSSTLISQVTRTLASPIPLFFTLVSQVTRTQLSPIPLSHVLVSQVMRTLASPISLSSALISQVTRAHGFPLSLSSTLHPRLASDEGACLSTWPLTSPSPSPLAIALILQVTRTIHISPLPLSLPPPHPHHRPRLASDKGQFTSSPSLSPSLPLTLTLALILQVTRMIHVSPLALTLTLTLTIALTLALSLTLTLSLSLTLALVSQVTRVIRTSPPSLSPSLPLPLTLALASDEDDSCLPPHPHPCLASNEGDSLLPPLPLSLSFALVSQVMRVLSCYLWGIDQVFHYWNALSISLLILSRPRLASDEGTLILFLWEIDKRATNSGSKVSATQGKGAKKNKANKVEQVLMEENTSVAPPPHFSSRESTQVLVGETGDLLNEDETLMPLGSQLETMNLNIISAADDSDKSLEGSMPLGSELETMDLDFMSASNTSDQSLEGSENSMEIIANISDEFQEEDTNADKSEDKDYDNSSKENNSETESDVEDESMNIDTDITPKKGITTLKCGRAPSSPTDAHHSRSKVSKHSESHSSATSSLSKDELQGASRTAGGFSHGRATGNVYNYGNDEDDPFTMPPENIKGQIHLFLKPEAPKPDFILTDQEPLSDLQEVLENISEVYSPIAKKNPRISLRENGNWSIKGCYMNIKEKKVQTAKWQVDDKNIYYLEILADGADKNDITTMAAPSGSSSTDEEVVKHLIISHFNILEHLIKSKGKEDIHAVIIQTSVKATIDKKVLISVFMSPSTYYTYPYKSFPLLKYHPQMVSWLKNEGGVDKKSVWGSKKPGFSTLYEILKGKEAAAEDHKNQQSKGKGKEREEGESDDNEEGVKEKDQEDMSENKGKGKSKKSHKKDKGKSKKL
ncbi:hypothetical protein BDQ17DRAFT_1438042 [Cyathus striatus]|nr:hypothetical protein BDQ17DRAFT_1438042 [Cyathus striatus]